MKRFGNWGLAVSAVVLLAATVAVAQDGSPTPPMPQPLEAPEVVVESEVVEVDVLPVVKWASRDSAVSEKHLGLALD